MHHPGLGVLVNCLEPEMGFLVTHIVALLVGNRVITLWAGLLLRDCRVNRNNIEVLANTNVAKYGAGMNFENYIPKDKHDIGAIERADLVGFPELNPIIPELLEWVQDANWPVASGAAALLAKADTAVIPHIQAVLRSDDAVWKYWIIETVVPSLAPSVFEKLRVDLVRLATRPTPEDKLDEVDQAARDVLALRGSPNSS